MVFHVTNIPIHVCWQFFSLYPLSVDFDLWQYLHLYKLMQVHIDLEQLHYVLFLQKCRVSKVQYPIHSYKMQPFPLYYQNNDHSIHDLLVDSLQIKFVLLIANLIVYSNIFYLLENILVQDQPKVLLLFFYQF